jgi:hypothetical protein
MSITCMSEIGSGRVGELGCVKVYHTCQIYVPTSGQAGQDLQLYQWALRGTSSFGALCFQRATIVLSPRALDSDRTVPATHNGNSRRMSLQLCKVSYQVSSEHAIAARGHFDARLIPARPTFDDELGR